MVRAAPESSDDTPEARGQNNPAQCTCSNAIHRKTKNRISSGRAKYDSFFLMTFIINDLQ